MTMYMLNYSCISNVPLSTTTVFSLCASDCLVLVHQSVEVVNLGTGRGHETQCILYSKSEHWEHEGEYEQVELDPAISLIDSNLVVGHHWTTPHDQANDGDGHCRDKEHVNPSRRTVALFCSFLDFLNDSRSRGEIAGCPSPLEKGR